MENIKRQAQQLLEAGNNVAEVARALNVLPTTLHKAIRSQRLEWNKKTDSAACRARQHQE